MPQAPPFAAASPVNPTRWRPAWAFAVAIVLLVACAGGLGLGLMMVIDDLSRHNDFLDGIGAIIGGMIGVPALLAGIPLVIFLARRGGRVPFFLGLAFAVASMILLIWTFKP